MQCVMHDRYECVVCFSGLLYSCGLNTYHPLGVLPVMEKCLAPKLVDTDYNFTSAVCQFVFSMS